MLTGDNPVTLVVSPTYTCMRRLLAFLFVCLPMVIMNCQSAKKEEAPARGTYAFDKAFLEKNTTGIVELTDTTGTARMLTSAQFQGRVMSTTAMGEGGNSYGWLNYDLLASRERKAQFNPVGGEERFWLGPEGGQFSLYFHAPDSFTFDHWKVPALIDTEPFEVIRQTNREVVFSRKASLSNYTGFVFDLAIQRTVSLLERDQVALEFGVSVPEGLHLVGYRTENEIQNSGATPWTTETGLISVWLLGMFTPSDQTTVIIPFHPSPGAREKITTSYFGEIPSDRLTIGDSVLFFSCDGKFRSKIGLSPDIAKPFAGSFDFERNILTVIHFDVSPGAPYVNSKWEHQENPYKGDVVNSYNDGPLVDGKQMGPFYELESSSAALALAAGAKQTYRQTTIHIEGDFGKLKLLASQLLGVDLEALKK